MWQTVVKLTPTECTDLEDLLERRASLVNLSRMLNDTGIDPSDFVDIDPTAVTAQVNKAQEQIGEWWSRTLEHHGLSRDSRMVYRADLEGQEIKRFADTGVAGQVVNEGR